MIELKDYIVIGFKIYYGDGSIYTSNDGPWSGAPNQNVQFVMAYYDILINEEQHGRGAHSGSDYYYWDENPYHDIEDGSDINKTFGTILYGKWTTDENLKEIQKKAMADYNI